MRIPNAHLADAKPDTKLRRYVLDFYHPVGMHKARLWQSIFGITINDADALAAKLVEAATSEDAVQKSRKGDVQLFEIQFSLEWQGKRHPVLSAWKIEGDNPIPQLVTVYPIV